MCSGVGVLACEPRRATPRHAAPRRATPRHAAPRRATPRHAVPRRVRALYKRRYLLCPQQLDMKNGQLRDKNLEVLVEDEVVGARLYTYARAWYPLLSPTVPCKPAAILPCARVYASWGGVRLPHCALIAGVMGVLAPQGADVRQVQLRAS